MCYMITSIGGQRLDPVSIRINLQKELDPADYIILQEKISELEDYGLRGGGTTTCPACKSKEAAFIAFTDERLFRPDLACLREWKHDRDRRKSEDVSRTS